MKTSNLSLSLLLAASLVLNGCSKDNSNVDTSDAATKQTSSQTNTDTSQAKATKNTTFNGEWEGCVISMFTEAENATYPKDGISAVKAFEDLIGHDVGSVMWFPTFEDPFPSAAAQEAFDHGLVPHITWELFWPSKNYNTHPIEGEMFHGFKEVLAGEHDDYIDTFAKAAADFGEPVLIRFLHEFNGNWYVWSGNKNGA